MTYTFHFLIYEACITHNFYCIIHQAHATARHLPFHRENCDGRDIETPNGGERYASPARIIKSVLSISTNARARNLFVAIFARNAITMCLPDGKVCRFSLCLCVFSGRRKIIFAHNRKNVMLCSFFPADKQERVETLLNVTPEWRVPVVLMTMSISGLLTKFCGNENRNDFKPGDISAKGINVMD